jgi:hypothetical protein
MKRNILIGSAIAILGLLLIFGPKFLFKACSVHDYGDAPPHCFYSIRAELGVGIIIVALGICFILLSDLKIQQGLTVGLFFMGIIALFIPTLLIGGCAVKTMRCHTTAFPLLIIISSIVLAGAVLNMVLINRKIKA